MLKTAASTRFPSKTSHFSRGRMADAAEGCCHAWMLRALAASGPRRHVDVSHNPRFALIASALVPVDFHGFAMPDLRVPRLRPHLLDRVSLPLLNESQPSISSIGIVEQLGLGLATHDADPAADLNAMLELKRVLAPDGSLLLAFPVGQPRVVFNSHRVYGFDQILDALDGLELEQFAAITSDETVMELRIDPDPADIGGFEDTIGCFWLRKPVG